MVPALIAWLKGRAVRPGRSSRVTTITRTVTREKGGVAQPEQVERQERVEETVVPAAGPVTHVSIAVTSVAAVVAAAFVVGWLVRRARG